MERRDQKKGRVGNPRGSSGRSERRLASARLRNSEEHAGREIGLAEGDDQAGGLQGGWSKKRGGRKDRKKDCKTTRTGPGRVFKRGGKVLGK